MEVVLSSTRVMSTRRMPCLPSSVNQVRIHIYCVMFSSCNELFFRFVSTHHRHQLSLFLNLNFSDSRPIVLFDGECNLCNKFIQTLLKQSLGGSSKCLKVVQYLALLGYILPTRVRDGLYQIVSKRRKKWFGSSDECLLRDDRFETRFVDDGVLTGISRSICQSS